MIDMATEFQLTPVVERLLFDVRQQLAPRTLGLKATGSTSDTLNPSASQIQSIDGEGLVLTIPNPKFANFIVAHELLHLQQEELQSLKTSAIELPQQKTNLAAQLVEVFLDELIHQGMRQKLTKLAVTDLPTQVAISQYITEHLLTDNKKEPKDESTTLLANTFAILQGLVFLDSIVVDQQNWQQQRPQAWTLAQQLWESFKNKPLQTNRQLRTALISLMNNFRQIHPLGLGQLDFEHQVLITPVLSPRQLKLQIGQLFLLWHHPQEATAYLVMGVQDEQAAWQLHLPASRQTEAQMQAIYQLTVAEFLQTFKLPYAQRDGLLFGIDNN